MAFFDESGLAYLWSRIKALFAEKQVVQAQFEALEIDAVLVKDLADVPDKLRKSGGIVLLQYSDE